MFMNRKCFLVFLFVCYIDEMIFIVLGDRYLVYWVNCVKYVEGFNLGDKW